METRSMTVHTTPHERSPCPCGCAPCEDTCCGVDCLVAPRFFCGQLLTDQDLSALVGWTRDKLRLQRYRDGWGVVCGLEVRCSGEASSVVVGRGYAISCCGDDIVVCDDTLLDLSGACGDEIDPCGDVYAEPDPRERYRLEGAGGIQPQHRELLPRKSATHDSGHDERLHVVDVYVDYAEQPTDAQTALGRSACGEVGECEFSRVREQASLRWERAGPNDPVTAAATRWKEAYDSTLNVLRRFRDTFGTLAGAAPEDVRRWLVSWIDANPLSQFCFLRDRICAVQAESLTREATVARYLFMLVQDARNGFLGCDCFECGRDRGVLLARVYMREEEDAPHRRGSPRCHVERIDPYPPFRRPLQSECWPAPLGSVNAGQVIWHRAEEACTRLADLGVRAAGTADFVVPPTLAELEAALDCDPLVRCGESRVVQIHDAGPLGRRVVGFCGGVGDRRLGLAVDKGSQFTEARPNQDISYSVDVANSGEVTLDVTVEDDHAGFVGQIELPPGRSHRFGFSAVVPSDAVEAHTNTVKATGTAEDGRSVTEIASYTLRVVAPSLALGLEKTCVPELAKPAEVVEYRFTVNNPNDDDLDVEVDDAQIGPVGRVTVAGGTSQTLTQRWQVPEDAPSTITNKATATATTSSGDGRTVTAEDEHTLEVAIPEPEPKRPGLRVSKRGPASARPGDAIPYAIIVANTGNVDLHVALLDEEAGVKEEFDLPVADPTRQFAGRSEMPGHTRALNNTAIAIGTTQDGEEVHAEGTWTVALGRAVEPERDVLGDETSVLSLGGIGRVRARLLAGADIHTLGDLADVPFERLEEILASDALVTAKLIEDWQKQAREAARR